MTTEQDSASDPGPKRLAEIVVKGDHENAATSAQQISTHRSEVNDLVDAISDAMNIVSDLHEINRYTDEQVDDCEKAAEKALEVLRPKIRVEQTRISGKVMVAALEGDPHSFDKTLLMAMLEIGGFTPLDGGSEISPEELVVKIRQLDPDILAVPLVTESAANNLATVISLLGSNKPRPGLVAYGRGAAKLAGSTVPREEDTLGALSRIAELLIPRG